MKRRIFKYLKIVILSIVGFCILLFILAKIGWFSLGMNKKEPIEVPDNLAKVQDYWFYQKGVLEGAWTINSDEDLWILKEGNCDGRYPKYPLRNFHINLGEIKSIKYKDTLVLNKLLDSASVDVIKNISPKKCFDSLIIEYHYFDPATTEERSYKNYRRYYKIR